MLYLITFVTSISALALYETVLRHPERYIVGAGHDTQVLLGALLELVLIIANIGTAVVIFPIVRRQNEELALGYVTARLLIIVSGTAVMFTGNQPSSPLHALQGVLSIPEILCELFLGVYCTIWGFRRDATILSASAR